MAVCGGVRLVCACAVQGARRETRERVGERQARRTEPDGPNATDRDGVRARGVRARVVCGVDLGGG